MGYVWEGVRSMMLGQCVRRVCVPDSRAHKFKALGLAGGRGRGRGEGGHAEGARSSAHT